MEKFIVDQTKRPNIAFVTVTIIHQSLRSHLAQFTCLYPFETYSLESQMLNSMTWTQSPYLSHISIQEDPAQCKVFMDNIHFCQIAKPTVHIDQYQTGLLLTQRSVLVDIFLEVSSWTMLSNKGKWFLSQQKSFTSKHIGMFQIFKRIEMRYFVLISILFPWIKVVLQYSIIFWQKWTVCKSLFWFFWNLSQ